jgi:glycosyltransferase involved in cell wall biosynthesis
MVSVVIAAYDEPEMLRAAVDSVAAQDYRDFELIVVDDGSPRDLGPAIEAARARLGDCLRVEHQRNAGAAAARNRGIELARGRWVALLDHDDLWLPNKLTRQVAVANGHPEAAMIYCQYQGFGDGADAKISPPQGASGRILVELLDSTLIRTLSVVLIRRDAFGRERWFDPRYQYANDIDLYYRLAQHHPIEFVEEVLVRKRSHPAQASRNLLEAHDESVAIVKRLRERLGSSVDAPLACAIQKRLCRHLLGAAKSAKARGDRALSHRRYAELLESNPWHPRGWRGWLATLF